MLQIKKIIWQFESSHDGSKRNERSICDTKIVMSVVRDVDYIEHF